MTTKNVLAFCSGIFCFFFGSDPAVTKFVVALIICMSFDIVTGVVASFINNIKFDYRIFTKGFLKKILFLLAVSFGYFIDLYEMFGNIDVSFQTAFAGGFIITEVLSVVQNFAKCGIKMTPLEKYIKLD